MDNAKIKGVPSQQEVPRQRKFPVEGAANMTFDTTQQPTSDYVDTNRRFPTPKMKTIEECREFGGFNSISHTNGK